MAIKKSSMVVPCQRTMVLQWVHLQVRASFCISDEMDGMENEKEVGNVGSNMRQKMEIVKSLKLSLTVIM